MKVSFQTTESTTRNIDFDKLYNYIKADLEEEKKQPATKADVFNRYTVGETYYLERVLGVEIEDNLQNDCILEDIYDEFRDYINNL